MAPNESDPLSKPDRPGQRVFERDAQNSTEAGAVMGRALRDIQCSHSGRSTWVRASGRPEGGNDNRTTPTGKSDLSIRATKPVKAGGAKGEMD